MASTPRSRLSTTTDAMTSPTLHATSSPSILRLLAAPVDTAAGVDAPVWLAVGTGPVETALVARDALDADDGATTAKTPGATGWGVLSAAGALTTVGALALCFASLGEYGLLGWPGVVSGEEDLPEW